MCHLGIAGVGTKAAQEIDVENTGALSVPTTEGANSGGGAGEENVSVFNADNKTFFCFLILSTKLDSYTFLLYAAEIFSHCCLWRLCFVDETNYLFFTAPPIKVTQGFVSKLIVLYQSIA